MSLHKGITGQAEGGASAKTNVESFDRYPYMKHSTANPNTEAEQAATEKTLAQYIQRKLRNDAFNTVKAEKKMTFEEWWSRQLPVYGDKPFEYMVDAAEAAWKAAQENM